MKAKIEPCPQCKAEHRWLGRDGLIHCDICGYAEGDYPEGCRGEKEPT